MKMRVGILAAIAVLLGLLVAVPVDAKSSFRGTQDLYFNDGFNPMLEEPVGCSHMTWAGVIDVDGVQYGITYQPIGRQDTGKAYHFQEIWRVYDEAFAFEGGLFTGCDAAVAMWGYDAGVGMPNGKGHASGTVEDVTAGGSLDENLTGRRVHWSGVVGAHEIGLTFSGPFRIN